MRALLKKKIQLEEKSPKSDVYRLNWFIEGLIEFIEGLIARKNDF
jgi:hypothetical protein